MRKLALVLVALAAAPAAWAASPAPDAPAPAPGAAARSGVAPGIVNGEEARRLVAAGVKVVDVRTPEEFAQGHVPGAVNIPYDELGRRHAELGPPTTPVLVYCRTGRRSARASATLRAHGFSELYDLQSYDRWPAR